MRADRYDGEPPAARAMWELFDEVVPDQGIRRDTPGGRLAEAISDALRESAVMAVRDHGRAIHALIEGRSMFVMAEVDRVLIRADRDSEVAS